MSTLLCLTVNVCELLVQWHDVCNTAPPTCISVNFVEVPLNVIRCNVHKTVVSYKTVQAFCSDVAIQNVNIISSPTCMVLCFTSQMFYVSNIPIHSYTINKIIFIITTITIIIIIIIIFNFNITIIIVIIIIAIIKSTIVIIIILSFVLHFFDIKICVSPSQHLNYCHKVALQ